MKTLSPQEEVKRLAKKTKILAYVAISLGIISLALSLFSLLIPVLSFNGYLTIFEDGSYWLFNSSGCLPFSLCN